VSDLVIVVPMLGRAHRVVPLLESIDSTVPQARVLFALSPHDREVRRAVTTVGRQHITVPFQPCGDYARKINTGFRHTHEPLIFLAADDLLFHPGWFEAALAQLKPGVGVVGTNDLGSPRVVAGEHSTHSLVARDYINEYGGTADQPGEVLHEGYIHEWCDDELVGVAQARNAWAFAAGSHVEHLHPCWGKASTDPLYRQQQARMRRSRGLFKQRSRMWT
jgi:hypothetical protein